MISNYDRDYNSSKIDKLFEIIKTDIIPQYLNLEKISKPTIFKSDLSKDDIFQHTNLKLKELGFNFDYGRIDQSMHPFCGGANKDVRITTRFEDNILETLSALFHETGHGVYEQNRPTELLYEPIGQARSLSVHESQSLFYENHIFKSKSYFQVFNEIFDGVPSNILSMKKLQQGIEIENLLATETNFLKSISEARRALKENSISINKRKITANTKITKDDLINGKYILLQRGKKNYYLVIVN